MRLTQRTLLSALAALGPAWLLTGCAAFIPSASSGTTEACLEALRWAPTRVAVDSDGIMQFDPVGDVLRAELPALGFSIEGEHAEATFTAVIETSDFAPVRLELTLREHKTGRTLWRVQVERKWDLYASIVSASKSNARLAMKLLRIDLAAAKAPR